MTIDEIVAVSGLPGLFKIGGSRPNGMIVEEIVSGKSRFVSMRKHQFTPMGTVAIYTDDDATEINTVFETIAAQEESNPPPALSSSSKDLFAYFGTILPEFDRERVLVSDVKKVIKWYHFLKKHDLFPFDARVEEESEKGEEE